VARRVAKDEQELNKCRRSILMHNAEKRVAEDAHTAGYSLAEKVTSAIYRITGGMVMVMGVLRHWGVAGGQNALLGVLNRWVTTTKTFLAQTNKRAFKFLRRFQRQASRKTYQDNNFLKKKTLPTV
jgi:hypothetical protein